MCDTQKLRVVVANPLPESLCQLIEQAEPRIELVRDQTLLPPMRWYADYEGDPAFKRTPEQEAKFEALINSADILYGIPNVSPTALANVVRSNPQLKWVQIMAAGGGGQVKAAQLTEQELARVKFTTGSGAHAQALAEYALFGLMCGAKDFARLQQQKQDKVWSGRWAMKQLSAQKILVLGLGNIGLEVAHKAKLLGATVYGVDRKLGTLPHIDKIFLPENLVEVVKEVDAIVNTLPGTEFTHHLLSHTIFANVKNDTTLVSVGRGTVIDESALIPALKTGKIGLAVLDVFEQEPLEKNSELWRLNNVIISPHTAANNRSEETFIAQLFIQNLSKFMRGEPLINLVNTIEFY